VPTGSVVDLVCHVGRETSKEEINEAVAAQVIPSYRDLGIDIDRPWRRLRKKDRDWLLYTDEQASRLVEAEREAPAVEQPALRAEVGREGQLAAAPEGVAVHGGYGGDGAPIEERHRGVPDLREALGLHGVHLAHRRDVRPGDEHGA